MARQVQSYIKINSVYISALMKMIGITYIAEFASGICKDAGYGSLGSQIEIFGKLSILAVSMPILLALMETVQGFYHETEKMLVMAVLAIVCFVFGENL